MVLKFGVGRGFGHSNRRTQTSFTPGSLFLNSEPGAWYDPSDLSTLFQDAAGTTPVTAAGQVVGLMRDKSGRGNHASQTTAASQPILQQDGNGRYYLLFDGVDDFLVTPTITPGIDKAQVFAGVRKLSDAAAGAVVESSASYTSNPGAFGVFAPLSVGVAEYTFGASGDEANTGLSGSTYTAPKTSVLTGLFDLAGAGRTTEVMPRVNGATPGTLTNRGSSTAGGGNFLAYPLYIGRRAGTGLPFKGHLYGLIARFGANLDAATIAKTEAWLNQRTGAY